MDHASGQDWYIEQRKPHGGFCFIHANSIQRVWQSLSTGEIQLRDLRTWLACHEMNARRCQSDPDRIPNFTADEAAQLIGAAATQHARASLHRLDRLGFIQFDASVLQTIPTDCQRDKGRPIPVPRPLLRMLCRQRGRAFIATVLGHLLRCLYYRNGVCRSGGWCKASWIAETFQVAVRAVKDARKRLVNLGLCRLLDADQRRLNRFGRPLVWRLDWGRRSAPRSQESTAESAPPIQHKKLSLRRSDHQQPAPRKRPTDAPGVCTQTTPPDLRNVTEADLKDPWRLAALFRQAKKRGWVQRCHADILAVYAAATHALRIGTRNPPGLFRSMVERGQWHHLSNADEDHAQQQLRRLRSS